MAEKAIPIRNKVLGVRMSDHELRQFTRYARSLRMRTSACARAILLERVLRR